LLQSLGLVVLLRERRPLLKYYFIFSSFYLLSPSFLEDQGAIYEITNGRVKKAGKMIAGFFLYGRWGYK
jgi:hypothetical protein